MGEKEAGAPADAAARQTPSTSFGSMAREASTGQATGRVATGDADADGFAINEPGVHRKAGSGHASDGIAIGDPGVNG
jgi:hypothetical protein